MTFNHQYLLIAANVSTYLASFVSRLVGTFFPRTLGDNYGSAPCTNRFPAHLSFLSLQDVVGGDVVLASITGRSEPDLIELVLQVRRTKLCTSPTIALESGASQ
jgi:hypothetical protein